MNIIGYTSRDYGSKKQKDTLFRHNSVHKLVGLPLKRVELHGNVETADDVQRLIDYLELCKVCMVDK